MVRHMQSKDFRFLDWAFKAEPYSGRYRDNTTHMGSDSTFQKWSG